ncbi:acyltransferase [Bacteroides sp.]
MSTSITTAPLNNQQHIVWLDVVRFIAMFTVVCCHCTDPFNFYPEPLTDNIADIKLWGAIYGALLRPCVPLFVMITGALLLPVRGDASVFYKKRIFRVLWPFLIWSVVYNLFPWITGLFGLNPTIIQDFFPYAGEEVTRQSLAVSVDYIAQIPFNFSIVDVHMWYIYLLIGLYLYLPIFSAWVEKASEKAKLWFLAVWGVTLLLPYYNEFVAQYLWGTCSWNAFGMLYYFAGFNGYLLLGHYLRNLDWSIGKTLAIGIPMFAVGYAVTFAGFRYITALPEYTDEMLELFFTYCSLNVVMMTIPVFMLAKKANPRSETVRKALANLTVCGFGIYMIHYFFTGPSVVLMRNLNLPLGLQIPAASVVAFGVSWLIVWAVYRAFGKKAKYVMG